MQVAQIAALRPSAKKGALAPLVGVHCDECTAVIVSLDSTAEAVEVTREEKRVVGHLLDLTADLVGCVRVALLDKLNVDVFHFVNLLPSFCTNYITLLQQLQEVFTFVYKLFTIYGNA